MLYVAALQVSRRGSKLVVLSHLRPAPSVTNHTETDKSKAVVYVASSVVNQHVDTFLAFSKRYESKALDFIKIKAQFLFLKILIIFRKLHSASFICMFQ